MFAWLSPTPDSTARLHCRSISSPGGGRGGPGGGRDSLSGYRAAGGRQPLPPGGGGGGGGLQGVAHQRHQDGRLLRPALMLAREQIQQVYSRADYGPGRWAAGRAARWGGWPPRQSAGPAPSHHSKHSPAQDTTSTLVTGGKCENCNAVEEEEASSSSSSRAAASSPAMPHLRQHCREQLKCFRWESRSRHSCRRRLHFCG